MAGPKAPSRWLNSTEAAAYIGYRPQTLANWRNLRKGPRFEKPHGEVRYNLADLDAWMHSQPQRSAG